MDRITTLHANHPIRFFVLGLLLVLGLGMAGYLLMVHGAGKIGGDPIKEFVEAANYATQTITTVGYGNFCTTAPCLASNSERNLKLFSSLYTMLSVLIWTVMIERALAGR